MSIPVTLLATVPPRIGPSSQVASSGQSTFIGPDQSTPFAGEMTAPIPSDIDIDLPPSYFEAVMEGDRPTTQVAQRPASTYVQPNS